MILLRKFKHWLSRRRLPFWFRFQGNWMYGWPIKKLLHPHEIETVRFFERNVKKTDIVVDIGAERGYYTQTFSRLAKKVYAFEPDPINYKWLYRATHKLENVLVIPIAIYNKTSAMNLSASRPGSGVGSIVYIIGNECTEVLSMPLSSFPIEADWIKIDAEGAELEILEGMKKTHCTVEFSPKNLSQAHLDSDGYLDAIESMGYTIYFINNDGTHEKKARKEIEKLVQGHCNLYLEPN